MSFKFIELQEQCFVPELQSDPEEDTSGVRFDHDGLGPSITSLFGLNGDLLNNLAMLRYDEWVMNISVRMKTRQNTQCLILVTFHGEIPRRLREGSAGNDQTIALKKSRQILRYSQDENG